VKLVSIKDSATGIKPKFIDILSDRISFSVHPTVLSEVKIYIINVTIEDNHGFQINA
jgi:hypothetical protein